MSENQPPYIDYNYYNTPTFITNAIEGIGGMGAVLSFCQTHHVEVIMGSDYGYNAWIDERTLGCWSSQMDAFSSLICGIAAYLKHHQPTPQQL